MNITMNQVEEAIRTAKPTSLNALFHALGGKGKPGSSARAAITKAMPNVAQELAALKAKVASQVAEAPQATKAPQKKVASKPQSAGNPYNRSGSSYGAIWESVKRNPGKSKAWHIKRLVSSTGKSEKNLGFDWHVVIRSALDAKSKKAIGAKGQRHRSTKAGYTAGAKIENDQKVFWIN